MAVIAPGARQTRALARISGISGAQLINFGDLAALWLLQRPQPIQVGAAIGSRRGSPLSEASAPHPRCGERPAWKSAPCPAAKGHRRCSSTMDVQVPFTGCVNTLPSSVVVSVPLAWKTGLKTLVLIEKPSSLVSLVPEVQPLCTRSECQSSSVSKGLGRRRVTLSVPLRTRIPSSE